MKPHNPIMRRQPLLYIPHYINHYKAETLPGQDKIKQNKRKQGKID